MLNYKAIKIIKCSDPSFWYHDKVGQVYVVKVDRDGYWARDAGGYINLIQFEDAESVQQTNQLQR